MSVFQEYLKNIIYDAMARDEEDKDYLANVALAALQTIKLLNKFAKVKETRKNSLQSEYYREEGNKAYKNGTLQKALVNYNKAIAYAPNGSLCLKFAYGNRSALLFSAKQYKACENDCITALAIQCVTPSTLTKKLEKRISQARTAQITFESVYRPDKVAFKNFAEDYLKLKSQNNDVPCVSADVDVVMESGIPKVIAKRDIAAGTLVGLEKAFVTWAPTDSDQYFSCYFCRKLDFNLIPCGGCVSAMFCSRQCEKSCMKEYHTDECRIAGFFIDDDDKTKWSIRATLKLINMCASWDELISMSYDYGYDRIEKSTVNDICDGENPSSILSFHKERHFLHGQLYRIATRCACYLHILQNLHSFLPEDWDRKLSATKAIARIMMYLSLYTTPTLLTLVANVTTTDLIEFHNHSHFGLFSFVGKVKHSCMSNLQILTVNNSVALVALENIKAGTELTISHILHWLDNSLTYEQRRFYMFLHQHTFCTCVVCSANPEVRREEAELTATQKRAIQECIPLEVSRIFCIPVSLCFKKSYKALSCLQNIPFSKDYDKVYGILQRLQMNMLANKLQNVKLSNDF